MSLQRRCFLSSVSASLAFGASLAKAETAMPHFSQFAGLFFDPVAAENLGRRFLDRNAQASAATRAFAVVIINEMRARQIPMRDLVAARVKADFVAGRILVEDGWVLAEGEILACAALAARA